MTTPHEKASTTEADERSARDAALARKPARTWVLVRLGVSLAAHGFMAKAGLLVAALTCAGGVSLATVAARSSGPSGEGGGAVALGNACALTASALAWGAGLLIAFSAAGGALLRDHGRGVRGLLAARGVTRRSYFLARAAGLSALLAAVVGGGALLVDFAVASLVGERAQLAAASAASCGALAYGLAFGLVVGPLTLAALGARSRLGAYGRLLVLLVGPDLVLAAAPQALPPPWRHVASLASALATFRRALTPPVLDLALATRALCVLALFLLVAVALASRELARADARPLAAGAS